MYEEAVERDPGGEHLAFDQLDVEPVQPFARIERVAQHEAAVACGLAALISADPVRAAAATALRLSRLDPRRIELWRCLRGPRFVDRFRASVVHK